MSESTEPVRRRRARRRATAQQGPPQVARGDESPPSEAAPKQIRRREPKGRGRPDASARSDRDLTGTVTSQVGPTGAMRARDLNRPTAEDLARAEAELIVVRRNWNPALETPPQPRRRRP